MGKEGKTITVTRKINLFPVGDKEEVNRVYKYLRDGMEVQSYMMNMCISAMYHAKLNKATKEDWKELTRYYSHIPTSSLGSPYSFDMKKNPTGLGTAGAIPRKCKQVFDKACKDGLMYGKVSLPSFKQDSPLIAKNTFIDIRPKVLNGKKIDNGFYHKYENYSAFYEALMNEKEPKLFLKFVNGITFKVILGNLYQSKELRTTIDKLFTGEYKICDSSIGIKKSRYDGGHDKIQLNLSMQIPIQEHKLDEKVVVGVDLGLAIPVMAATNNSYYNRSSFGSYDEFTRQRMKIKAEKRRIQHSLKYSSGGHGRKKKLSKLEFIEGRERAFAHTFNHNASRAVINFALKNNAKYINMEDLSGFGENESHEFVLKNWSYYELQQMITYKAEKEGIEVRKIKPLYTSQTCSICGERGTRVSQSEFICNNPKCNSHKLYDGKNINADFNAARNIALSENFA